MTTRKTTIALVAIVIGTAGLITTASAATRDVPSPVVTTTSERASIKIDEVKATHETAPTRN